MSKPSQHRIAGLSLWLVVIGSLGFWLHRAAAGSTASLEQAIVVQEQRVARENSAAAFNDLANLYVLARRHLAAEDAYARALELDPANVEALYNLALLYGQEESSKRALELLERARELEPENAWVHFQIGRLHADQGRRRSAIRAYRRAFSLDNRLALPSVNPEVSHDRIATAALLQIDPVYGQDGPARSYAEPGRIATLLLGEDAAEELAEADGDGATSAGLEPLGPARVEAAPSARFDPTESRELGEALEEALEEDAPLAEPAAREDDDPERRSARRRISVDQLDPGPATGVDPASTRSRLPITRRPGDARAEEAPAPSLRPSRFRPGRRSNARLELRLREPQEKAALPAPALAGG